ncbi:DUF1850 domain-containing protein [Nitrincola alkalilacustris]|uniref:DUF1850 domain-containing protein n=1 Tax=Nitrincola alkalilacustris TaxID=1571224 RepID=UPI00124D87F3|nr:DUF1850 domain-containing protein [Nitrincola alkalilacustris]
MKQYLAPIALSALLHGTATAAADCATQHLEARRSDQSLLAYVPLPDKRWCMHWHHSVAGFLVQDCYKTDRGELLLFSSHQPDFAAGLGHFPGRGVQHSDTSGGYLIEEINEPVTDNNYWIRIGSNKVSHRIVTVDDDFNLSAVAAGELVNIRLVVSQAQPDCSESKQ